MIESGIVFNTDLFVQGSITSDHVYSADFDKLKDEVELLKRKTNIEYAKECVKNELLEKYRKLVMSDIWWEACSAWIHKNVDAIIEKYKYSFGYEGLQYSTDYNAHFSNRSLVSMPYYNGNDIVFKTSTSQVSINELLNANPEIDGYDFEKFVVNYCSK